MNMECLIWKTCWFTHYIFYIKFERKWLFETLLGRINLFIFMLYHMIILKHRQVSVWHFIRRIAKQNSEKVFALQKLARKIIPMLKMIHLFLMSCFCLNNWKTFFVYGLSYIKEIFCTKYHVFCVYLTHDCGRIWSTLTFMLTRK